MFGGNKIMNKIKYLIRGYSEDEPKLVPSPKQRKRKRAERKKFPAGRSTTCVFEGELCGLSS